MNLLVTGRPGIGKTTVVEAAVASLPPAAVRGFFTREIRERGTRQGFAIHTLDGRAAVLAHVRFGEGPRVGRYRVSLADLERVALPAIAPRPDARLIVVDEIGKMECLSARFREAVRAALEAPIPVLATIAREGGGFIAEVRRRPDVTEIEVTAENRAALPVRIVEMLAL